MRADLAHAALNADLVMTASADQAELSNVRQLTKEIGQPLCPIYSADGCSQRRHRAPRPGRGSHRGGGDESFSLLDRRRAVVGGTALASAAASARLALSIVRARRRKNP